MALFFRQNPLMSPLEDHALPEGFLDRRVAFIATFVGDGVACSIITLEDKNSHTHTFSAVKGFTPLFMDIQITHANGVIWFHKC